MSTISTKRWRLIPMMIEDAPNTKGVFALWANDELVYLGQACGGGVTIHSRLSEYFRKRPAGDPRCPTHYSWEVCANPAERAKQLIEQLGYREEPKKSNGG